MPKLTTMDLNGLKSRVKIFMCSVRPVFRAEIVELNWNSQPWEKGLSFQGPLLYWYPLPMDGEWKSKSKMERKWKIVQEFLYKLGKILTNQIGFCADGVNHRSLDLFLYSVKETTPKALACAQQFSWHFISTLIWYSAENEFEVFWLLQFQISILLSKSIFPLWMCISLI